jgi:hypothetical protein
MESFGLFKRYWKDTGQRVDALVRRRTGARAYIPNPIQFQDIGEGCFKLAFDAPAFFYNVPQKGSSTKAGSSHRQAIFVDGAFTVCEIDNRVMLANASCNLEIYETREIAGESFTLRLVDAMHFDMESDKQSAFHPMFHVQRGASATITKDMIISKVAEITHLDKEKIQFDEGNIPLGLSYVRLPTPQMDYFSVLATITADFFCSEGQSDRNTKDEFRVLLRSLLSSKNITRDGRSSQALCRRWNADLPFGASHWYAESV